MLSTKVWYEIYQIFRKKFWKYNIYDHIFL